MARFARFTALSQSMFSSKDRFPSSPFLVPTQSRVHSILIILLQLAVIAFIVVLTLTGIYLRYPGNISSNLHIGYITGITILATLIASVTTGHIRSLWALKVTHHWYIESSSKRRREASTIVGLASVWDRVRCWPITISFLTTGLMTAALVAALTPTIVTVTQQALGNLNTKHTYLSEAGVCLLTNETSDWFSWEKSDGSSISINTTAAIGCELQQVRSVAARISYDLESGGYDRQMFRYSMSGIPVSNMAIGAPFSLNSGGFSDTFGVNADTDFVSDADYLWIRQCLPTVIRNPVRCQITGNVAISGNNITVTTGNCSVTNRVFGVDPGTQGATVSGTCTEGHTVGTAAIVMGSTNEHAVFLARAMNDEISETVSSYAVACSVDIAPSVSLRLLNFSREAPAEVQRHMYGSSFKVDGDNSTSCEFENQSLSDFLTDTVLATGAAASWSLLTERQYNDGWWPTLQSMMIGDFTFADSQNQLEDVLGLVSGIAMGMYWGTTGYYQTSKGDTQLFGKPAASDYGITPVGIYGVNAVRIGPAQLWASVYILPSLFSAILLLILMIQTWNIRAED